MRKINFGENANIKFIHKHTSHLKKYHNYPPLSTEWVARLTLYNIIVTKERIKMTTLELLKKEIKEKPEGKYCLRNHFLALGFAQNFDKENVIARAYAFKALLDNVPKYIYDNDTVAGSVRGLLGQELEASQEEYDNLVIGSYGFRYFSHNSDHFAPNYNKILSLGINGVIEEIDSSYDTHTDKKERDFLTAAKITMQAFCDYIKSYEAIARQKGKIEIADACLALTQGKPQSFLQALQLVWLCHNVFCLENRYAMALGRLDQYLYPFYAADIEKGILTKEKALELIECTLYKIHEARYFGSDDVVNIAIGGVKRDGSDAVNELSFIILDAVKNCDIPGPNLSARLHKDISDEFIEKCLEVIGTGLGYPALMNDEINIPALARHGYSIEDARDYCMVGCIENFIAGKQPPWTDGRYNTPKYMELALNDGKCMLTGRQKGIKTGDCKDFSTMEEFMAALEKQMKYGADEYMAMFNNENNRYNPENLQQPFLSCFCDDCISRAKDINNGGAHYPSAHGACGMGIATVADSLYAIEEAVFNKKLMSLEKLRDILICNFEGYEKERRILLNMDKYGNDCPEVDKYAVWFVEVQNRLFSQYKTRDGGPVYTAIASNVSNIPAGKEIAATADGRRAMEPVSDAASPMHGMDKNGPTAVVNSMTRPDYTLVSCGTVLNQKYSPSMFSKPENRKKLLALIKTYFKKGGQEIQINSVSRDILVDAMKNPEKYENLVVRVSGFSAHYITLSKEVQEDILKRTEQG